MILEQHKAQIIRTMIWDASGTGMTHVTFEHSSGFVVKYNHGAPMQIVVQDGLRAMEAYRNLREFVDAYELGRPE